MDKFPVWGGFSWIDSEDKVTCYTAYTGSIIGNVGLGSCVFDLLERRWVSKAAISVKGSVFNIDPCYESAKRFCHFALDWIKELKAGQITEKKGIPVISSRFELRYGKGQPRGQNG
jgi:hypothetical protein